MDIQNHIQSVLSSLSNSNVTQLFITILVVSVGCFLLSGLFRLIFGHTNVLVSGICAVLGILILYCIRIQIDAYISPFSFITDLPFVRIETDHILLLPYTAFEEGAFFTELFRLILLIFLFSLFEDILPEGKHLFAWTLLRITGIAITFTLFTVLEFILSTLLPGFIPENAPILLLGLLLVFLTVTLFKWLIGLILGVTAGPIIGGIYTFFISHIIGKQMTKSALTAALLLLLIQLAEYYGRTSLILTGPINMLLIPPIIILVAFRYLFKKSF